MSTCIHHWVIAAAAAALSPGVCQRCGEERSFSNHAEDEMPYGRARRPSREELAARKKGEQEMHDALYRANELPRMEYLTW